MRSGWEDYAAILLLIATIAVTGYGMSELSGKIAVHFNAAGQPDSYMSVVPGLLIAPVAGILTLLLFHYLPRIDPLGENYESFADLFDLLKMLIVGIFGYLQLMVVLWNLGYRYNPTSMVIPVVVSAYYLVGKTMEEAERNWFIGIRTPWTLSSERVWRQTHETAGPLMKLAAVISIGAFVFPEYSTYLFIGPVTVIAVFAFLYSYWLYRREG
ncbi:MAG: SdpI family protein [Candidatus Nanohaloarchaea archaeon]